MSFPQGIDFRSTLAFVTDPANCAFWNGSTAYPTTSAQGNNCGWETPTSSAANVSALTGDQAKLAGITFKSSTVVGYVFRIDLPSTGSYSARVGAGRADTTAQIAGPITLSDTSTVLTTLVTEHTATTGGTFYDATDVQRTSASDWVTNNAANTQTFSTTIARFTFGPTVSSGFWICAHIWLETASAGFTAIMRRTMGPRVGSRQRLN